MGSDEHKHHGSCETRELDCCALIQTYAALMTFLLPQLTDLSLHLVYYRLYVHKRGETASRHRIDVDDPSLSRVNVDWVQPPGRAGEYKYYICAREEIHPSRVSMYALNKGGIWVQIADMELISNFSKSGRGLRPEAPLKVLVELGDTQTMDDANKPLSWAILSCLGC